MLDKNKLKEICKSFSLKEKDSNLFIEIYNFLTLNTELKPKKYDEDDIESVSKLAKKFFNAKYSPYTPSTPGTVPDTIVDTVLHIYYKYDENKLLDMQKSHQHAMLAEGDVGKFIELYLDSILSKYGWIRCCGDIVKSTDFIKKVRSGYKALQVKSRNNTENSSSSKVREGTEIMKWFRYFSKSGVKNWSNFPDDDAKQELSEKGFVKFVKNYPKSKIKF